MEQDLARRSMDRELGQNGLVDAVPVMGVVRRELVIPSELARIGVERDHGIAVKIVTGADACVQSRRRIAYAPIDQVEGRIVGAGDPCAAAPALFPVAGPGLLARLAN